MNILRQILCLKIITIIALATLFISTMSIREAQARHRVKCPCPLAKTFLLQTKLAKAFGFFNRDDIVCLSTATSALLIHNTYNTTCSYSIAVGSTSQPSLPGECGAATSDCGFSLDYVIGCTVPLTEDEILACRKQIFLAAFLFGVSCNP